MNEEERQRVLGELAKRSPEEEAAAQRQHTAGADRRQLGRGCLFFAIAIPVVLVSIHFFVTPLVKPIGTPDPPSRREQADQARLAQGPIPRQFQGTFNHDRCGGFDSEIRVTGRSVRIGIVNFEADERVSSDEERVVLRGHSVAGGIVQEGERVTLRLTSDGSLIFNEGSPAARCD